MRWGRLRRQGRGAGVLTLLAAALITWCGGQVYAGSGGGQAAALSPTAPPDMAAVCSVLDLSLTELEDAVVANTEAEAEAKAQAEAAAAAAAAEPQFVWHQPLDVKPVISSAFGERESGFHHGADLACQWGTMIRAVADGTVTESGWKNDIYGYMVEIQHGNGWRSRYAHCGALAVETGEEVQAGQAIALVGSTGNSTGPHLHLELSKDGMFFDPLQLVPLAQ